MKILFKLNQTMQQRQHQKATWIFPIKLAMYATYLRNKGNTVIWDGKDDESFDRIVSSDKGIDVSFLDLPQADRILTDAMNPKWWQQNGNFKYHPGAYTMVAGGCWYGKCSFCVERNVNYKCRSVYNFIQELGDLYYIHGFREVFDDSATFPDGDWLREFCVEKIDAGLEHLHFSCNTRIDGDYDWELMKKAGFRMVLFGIESANQETLNRIKKGINYDQIIPTVKQAAKAGISCHGAVQFGYPWESDSDSNKTLALIHYLLRKGYTETAQASFHNVNNYESKEEARKYIKEIYKVAYSPEFWFNKIRKLKNWADIKYLYKQIKVGLKERA